MFSLKLFLPGQDCQARQTERRGKTRKDDDFLKDLKDDQSSPCIRVTQVSAGWVSTKNMVDYDMARDDATYTGGLSPLACAKNCWDKLGCVAFTIVTSSNQTI